MVDLPSLTPERQACAATWFAALRGRICTALETIEDEHVTALPKGGSAGRFVRKQWRRDEGGGGIISLMNGHVFEKVGVNISTVFGDFSSEFRAQIPSAA